MFKYVKFCLLITSIEKAGIGETLYTKFCNRNLNVTIFDFLKFVNNFIFKCLPKVKHIRTNNRSIQAVDF